MKKLKFHIVGLTHNSSVAEAHAANFATDFEFILLKIYC